MTGAEMAANLHPARLPEAFAALGRDDLLAAFGIGLVLAALCLTVFAPVLRPRIRPPSWQARLAGLADLPPAEAEVERLRLLAAAGAHLTASDRVALYAGRLEPSALEERLRAVRPKAPKKTGLAGRG